MTLENARGTNESEHRSGVHPSENAKSEKERGRVACLAWRLATPVRWGLIRLVRLYQVTLSPLVPGKCRFYPSCSRYFIEAVERHGVIRGVALGSYRILRCQPFCKGGFDPVP